MANQYYKNLLIKAQSGLLTIEDLNAFVLHYHDQEQSIARDIKDIKQRTVRTERSISDIETEYPLLPPEADDLSKAIQRKGVAVMGGKKSNAYHDKALRQTIYRDIYTEVKRQYGLIDASGRQQSYKKLRRKYLAGAFAVVEDYELPIALQNEVESLNELPD